MPGPFIATHKLPQRTKAGYKKMRGHLQALDTQKIGVLGPVQLIGKQALNVVGTELPWRQTDGMHYNKIDFGI